MNIGRPLDERGGEFSIPIIWGWKGNKGKPHHVLSVAPFFNSKIGICAHLTLLTQ